MAADRYSGFVPAPAQGLRLLLLGNQLRLRAQVLPGFRPAHPDLQGGDAGAVGAETAVRGVVGSVSAVWVPEEQLHGAGHRGGHVRDGLRWGAGRAALQAGRQGRQLPALGFPPAAHGGFLLFPRVHADLGMRPAYGGAVCGGDAGAARARAGPDDVRVGGHLDRRVRGHAHHRVGFGKHRALLPSLRLRHGVLSDAVPAFSQLAAGGAHQRPGSGAPRRGCGGCGRRRCGYNFRRGVFLVGRVWELQQRGGICRRQGRRGHCFGDPGPGRHGGPDRRERPRRGSWSSDQHPRAVRAGVPVLFCGWLRACAGGRGVDGVGVHRGESADRGFDLRGRAALLPGLLLARHCEHELLHLPPDQHVHVDRGRHLLFFHGHGAGVPGGAALLHLVLYYGHRDRGQHLQPGGHGDLQPGAENVALPQAVHGRERGAVRVLAAGDSGLHPGVQKRARHSGPRVHPRRERDPLHRASVDVAAGSGVAKPAVPEGRGSNHVCAVGRLPQHRKQRRTNLRGVGPRAVGRTA
mmetsp:Transcript_18712/g.46759  ORF Transcript_18712/g.46759 Transcript_18712/m.46759 type:complete len:521 (-) Transcript_18712:856-2418(-)